MDLILIRGRACDRVQVKYARSDGRTLVVRCRTQSLTGGRVRRTTRYTADTIDLLAVYDATQDRCYHIPGSEIATGMSVMTLRLSPARNGQRAGTRDADAYRRLPSAMEPDGFEPTTSCLQSRRSTS